MKKSTPSAQKHRDCEVEIVLQPFGPHAGKIICKRHGTFLQWLPKNYSKHLILIESDELKELFDLDR